MDPLIYVLAFCFGMIVGFVLDHYILPIVVDRWVQWARQTPRNDA